jgi:hypothetical protein
MKPPLLVIFEIFKKERKKGKENYSVMENI